MSPTMTTEPVTTRTRAASPLGLVFLCTLIGAAAQTLIKLGLAGAAVTPSLAGVIAILTNVQLMVGLALYGINTGLMILALKRGELSVLYPVIALTYVWVTILSVLVFKESLNVFKVLGLTTVVLGVAVLGRKS